MCNSFESWFFSSESFVLVICLLKLLQKKKTIFLLCSLREEGAAAGSTKKEGKLHHRSLRNWKYIEKKNATAWQRKRKKVYENNLLLVHTAVLAERTPRYHRVSCNLWLLLNLAQLLNKNKCYSKEYCTSLKISKSPLPNSSEVTCNRWLLTFQKKCNIL